MIRLDFSHRADVAAATAAAIDVVADGGVVVLPTESFYALGVDPGDRAAVDRVNALKGRPAELGLPVVCADWQQVESLVEIPESHRVRLGRIWPAALAVVASARRPLPSARGTTLAVRVPGHSMLRALLYRLGPLTATSANRHGSPPCVDVEQALTSLNGRPDLVLDGGVLDGGAVSTMVDVTVEPAVVIRAGRVAWEQVFDPETSTVSDR